MKFEVKSRYSDEVQFTAEIDCLETAHPNVKLGLAVIWAVKNGANLTRANLSGADLSGANLTGVNLTGADLYGANLYGANLYGANLYGANLTRANLSGVYLTGANLTSANLTRANLSGVNLYGANLSGANLTRANLSGVYLTGANLSGANLSGADLSGAKLPRFQIPQEGELIVYKKLLGGVCKLRIPPGAKRTASLVGRKCRAEFAEVLEAPESNAISTHDRKTKYVVGEIVKPDSYDPNPALECTNGIHFFLTKEEAEEY